MDGVFLGLAGLLLGNSLRLRPREIPRSRTASPCKTPSIPPLLLGLTQYILNIIILKFTSPVMLNLLGNIFPYCPAVESIQRINSSSINLTGRLLLDLKLRMSVL